MPPADVRQRPTVFPPIQTVSTGCVVAIVGFFSSFPIVLKGLDAVGATAEQAASGLMFAALSMGITGLLLALWTRQPVSVAWSTPGAALLAITPIAAGAGFSEAVFGFAVAGALTLLSGFWRPLSRLMTSIPPALAHAMLAGVLLSLCVVPFQAMAETPQSAIPIVATWFVAGLINRLLAVPAAVIAALLVVGGATGFDIPLTGGVVTAPVLVIPEPNLAAIVNIGLPLFLVTMATQNVPGIAVLRSFGYTPEPRPLLAAVGGASILSAPFGAPATCLAAITAAMCANPESHPDPKQRYWSAVMAGGVYCLFGLFAATITAVAAAAPPMVLGTLAGLALIGVFTNSAHAALSDEAHRDAAAITFLTTASGMALFGLSAAVWGLILGGAVYAIKARMRKP